MSITTKLPGAKLQIRPDIRCYDSVDEQVEAAARLIAQRIRQHIDERGNYRLANDALLAHVPLMTENVHRIEVERGPESAAPDRQRHTGLTGCPGATTQRAAFLAV